MLSKSSEGVSLRADACAAFCPVLATQNAVPSVRWTVAKLETVEVKNLRRERKHPRGGAAKARSVSSPNLLFHLPNPAHTATMFGWGAKSSNSAASTSSAPHEPTPPPPPRVRTLESLIEEELPIQRHSVAMEGGMPSCLTLFDNFFLCYCQSPSVFPPADSHADSMSLSGSPRFANQVSVPPRHAARLHAQIRRFQVLHVDQRVERRTPRRALGPEEGRVVGPATTRKEQRGRVGSEKVSFRNLGSDCALSTGP